MADQAFTEKTGSTQKNLEGANRTGKSATDQVLATGRDLRDKASEYASSTGDTIREQASDFADAAKEAGADAANRFKEMVDTQKHAGANYVGGIAEAMRRAARELDQDLPFAGTFLRKGASQVEAMSDSVKKGEFDDLLSEARDFARRQPAAFLGLTVLAGFGVVRFLKSAGQLSSSGDTERYSSGAEPARYRSAADFERYSSGVGSGRYSAGRGSEMGQTISEDMTENVTQGLKR